MHSGDCTICFQCSPIGSASRSWRDARSCFRAAATDLAHAVQPVARASLGMSCGNDLGTVRNSDKHEGIGEARKERATDFKVIGNVQEARERLRHCSNSRQYFLNFVESLGSEPFSLRLVPGRGC